MQVSSCRTAQVSDNQAHLLAVFLKPKFRDPGIRHSSRALKKGSVQVRCTVLSFPLFNPLTLGPRRLVQHKLGFRVSGQADNAILALNQSSRNKLISILRLQRQLR